MMAGGVNMRSFVCFVILLSLIELTGSQYTRMRSIWNTDTPNLAVDNDTSTCATSGWDTGTWWWMDLEQARLVTGVVILGTLDSFNIRVGNLTNTIGAQDGFDTNPLCEFSLAVNLKTETTFPCRQALIGRYVSIQNVDPLTITQMSLCNVNVI